MPILTYDELVLILNCISYHINSFNYDLEGINNLITTLELLLYLYGFPFEEEMNTYL